MNVINEIDSNYNSLAVVLQGAYDQAAKGKGKDRHATGEPFEQQVCCSTLKHTGMGGAAFQVSKKALESCRLPYPANVKELQGAINYAAAAIIEIERSEKERKKILDAGVDKYEGVEFRSSTCLDKLNSSIT